MRGLRRWHVILLGSEVLATIVVLLACKDVMDAQQAPHDWAHLFAGLLGSIVLTPGFKLLFWVKEPPLPAVCLTTAAFYTGLFYLFAAGVCRFVDSELFRKLQSVEIGEMEHNDLHRYLR